MEMAGLEEDVYTEGGIPPDEDMLLYNYAIVPVPREYLRTVEDEDMFVLDKKKCSALCDRSLRSRAEALHSDSGEGGSRRLRGPPGDIQRAGACEGSAAIDTHGLCAVTKSSRCTYFLSLLVRLYSGHGTLQPTLPARV